MSSAAQSQAGAVSFMGCFLCNAPAKEKVGEKKKKKKREERVKNN
jgi:hypothetical protein